MLTINGKKIIYEKCTIKEVLIKNDYNPNYVVAEVNGELLPKRLYEEFIPIDGSVLEIVSFVGGG